MTEAGWTREKPSKEGVYWFRWTVNSNSLIVSVAKDDCDWRVLEMGHQYDGALAGYGDGEWLGPITPDSYQQGRVAALDEVERYMAMRLRLAEASLATEILAGNEVKQGRERAAIAELHGMQRHVSDIKEYNAQQAQEQGGEK